MDKGEAMERVCEYYGADLADTVAFGDSMNDQQMLEYAGIAVAMGNSCQELKDCADIVEQLDAKMLSLNEEVKLLSLD